MSCHEIYIGISTFRVPFFPFSFTMESIGLELLSGGAQAARLHLQLEIANFRLV